MKKNTKIVDPINYPDYGDGKDYNSKPKKACAKPCKKEDPIEILINWGWQIEALVYTLAANFLLGTAIIITAILRK